MTNNKGIKRLVGICLFYIMFLLQAPAMENKDNYLDNLHISTLLKHNIFEKAAHYLNAADLLNLTQTCKVFFKKSEGRNYEPLEYTENIYSYYKLLIFNEKYFQVYENKYQLLSQMEIEELESLKYIEILSPVDLEMLKGINKLDFVKKLAIIDKNILTMKYTLNSLEKLKCFIF